MRWSVDVEQRSGQRPIFRKLRFLQRRGHYDATRQVLQNRKTRIARTSCHFSPFPPLTPHAKMAHDCRKGNSQNYVARSKRRCTRCAYGLSRPVAERLAAVEALRQPVMEALPVAEQRLQRVYRVTTLKRGQFPGGRRACASDARVPSMYGRSCYLGAPRLSQRDAFGFASLRVEAQDFPDRCACVDR